MLLGAANGQNGRDARREASWAWNHSWRCLPGCSWRVGSSAVPLVRVCAAGMASAWSWRTWRRALTTDFPLDMRMLGRFLVGLGRNRLSQCALALYFTPYSLSPSGLCLSIVTVRVLCAVDCVDGSQAQCTKTTSSAGVHVDLKTLYDRAAIPPNEYASRQCQASNQERGTWPPSEPPCRSWPEMPRAWPVNRP